jgi:hypothetical protein
MSSVMSLLFATLFSIMVQKYWILMKDFSKGVVQGASG